MMARMLGFLLALCATVSAAARPMLRSGSTDLEAQAPCIGDCGEQRQPLLQKISIFYEDDRKVAPRHGKKKNPYAAVGSLTQHSPLTEEQRSKGEEWGDVEFFSTAFLISPCHILTNQHAAFKNEKKPAKDEITQFWVGGEPGKDFEVSVRAKPVEWGPFDKTKEAADDWAVLELESCIGREYGYADLVPLDDGVAESMVDKMKMVGYPSDTGEDDTEMWLDPKCSLKGYDYAVGMAHDCASRPGSSGSPIITGVANGRLQVVALHSSADPIPGIIRKWDKEKANVAIPMSWISEKVMQATKAPSVWGNKISDGNGGLIQKASLVQK